MAPPLFATVTRPLSLRRSLPRKKEATSRGKAIVFMLLGRRAFFVRASNFVEFYSRNGIFRVRVLFVEIVKHRLRGRPRSIGTSNQDCLQNEYVENVHRQNQEGRSVTD